MTVRKFMHAVEALLADGIPRKILADEIAWSVDPSLRLLHDDEAWL
jgi:hypothetical protein